MKISAKEGPVRILGLKNKYLSPFLIALVFLLTSLQTFAQYDSSAKPTPINAYYTWPYGKFKSVITPPTDTFHLGLKDTGSIAYKNGCFYYWNNRNASKLLKWDTLSAGGGNGVGSGTPYAEFQDSVSDLRNSLYNIYFDIINRDTGINVADLPPDFSSIRFRTFASSKYIFSDTLAGGAIVFKFNYGLYQSDFPSGGGGAWGSITGTLSSQTDLQTALNAKVPTTRTVNGNALSSDVTVTDANLSTSDVTTNNATTSKHGFLKKLSNSATQFMDGTGNWSSPTGGVWGGITGTLSLQTDLQTALNARALKFTSWPSETTYGLIFKSSFFPDTLDFDKHGAISIVNNGTKLDMSNGSLTTPLANYVTIGEPHLLTDWTIEDTVKITGALGAATWGQWKPGIRSINTSIGQPIDVFLTMPTSNAGSANAYLYTSSLTSLATSAGTVSYSQNDVIAYRLTFRDSVVTGYVKNLTTGGTEVSVSYTYTSTSGTSNFKPNTAQFAFYGIGATGTEQLQGLSIYSGQKKNPNIMAFGPSRATPYFVDYWANGWGQKLNATYGSSVVWGGGADGIIELARTMDGVKRTNPRYVIMLDVIINSLRGSATTFNQAIKTYDSCVTVLQDAGITVFHANLPEDSTGGGFGATNVNNYIRVKYAATYIPVWDSIGKGTNIMDASYNSGDGLHLNTLGQAKIYLTIVAFITATGLIDAGTNRIGQANNSDQYITQSKGKVELSPYMLSLLNKQRKYASVAASSLSMSTNTVNTLLMSTGSNIIGDAPLSTNGTRVLSTQPFEAANYIRSSGTSSAFSLDNQTTSTQSWIMRSLAGEFTLGDASAGYTSRFHVEQGSTGGTFFPGASRTVSIGTSSPVSGFTLNVTGNNFIDGYQRFSGSSGGQIYDDRATSTSTYGIFSTTTANGLEFYSVASGVSRFRMLPSGKFVGLSYGSGTHTGTPTYNIDVDASGNFIETALKAPLASPTFTGTPAAPTASTSTSTTQIATTAFVQANKSWNVINAQSSFTSTGTVTISSVGQRRNYIDPATVLTSCSFELPSGLSDGDEIVIFFGGTIASGGSVVPASQLTITAAGGATIVQASTPTSAVSGDVLIYSYRASNTSFYRQK